MTTPDRTTVHAYLERRARQEADACARRADGLRGEAATLATLLRQEPGVEGVWLFGSLAWGDPHLDSDIDLAVRGLPESRYFTCLGRLLTDASVPVDLVRLEDIDPSFRARILDHGVPL
jgi:predicted nucleotidyltransferase